VRIEGTTVVLDDWDAVDFLGDSTVMLPSDDVTAPAGEPAFSIAVGESEMIGLLVRPGEKVKRGDVLLARAMMSEMDRKEAGLA